MENENGGTSVAGALIFHGPKAWVDVDEEAGTMISTSQARIVDAGVDMSYQRQGIGSEMHRIAQREMGPGITLGHSGSLSPAGYAFARSTGGDIPKSAQKGPTIEARGDTYPSVVARHANEDATHPRRVDGSPAVVTTGTKTTRRQGKQLQLDL